MKPCILVTNDDGIHSPGLRAAVAALAPLGDLVVVAPLEQYSGAGRSFAQGSRGRVEPVEIACAGGLVQAYGVDGSPTQAALHGLVEFAPRRPDLAVVGINYGENLGNGITASGTVGAALELAAAGVPALTVSRQVASKYYFTHSTEIDFTAAEHFPSGRAWKTRGRWAIAFMSTRGRWSAIRTSMCWSTSGWSLWRRLAWISLHEWTGLR